MDGNSLGVVSWKAKTPEGCHEGSYRVTLTEAEQIDLRKGWSCGQGGPQQKLVRRRQDSFVGRRIGRRFVEVRPGDCRIVGFAVEPALNGCAKRFVEDGLEAALHPKPSQRVRSSTCKMDGKAEGALDRLWRAGPRRKVVRVGRSPFAGRSDEWMLKARRVGVVQETVRRGAKKTNLSLG